MYELSVRVYDDGRFEMDCDFLKQEMIESLESMDLTPTVDLETAIQTAKEYSDGLDVTYFSEYPEYLGQYNPSSEFGSYSELIVYSIKEQVLAYKIYDSTSLNDAENYPWGVNLEVYVNAHSGTVIDHEINASLILID